VPATVALHYIENSKTKVENELVLMDLGAEYHGYTAVDDTHHSQTVNFPQSKNLYMIWCMMPRKRVSLLQQLKFFKSTDVIARKVIYEGQKLNS
jgi:Xaa-Pro aminopeptidase